MASFPQAMIASLVCCDMKGIPSDPSVKRLAATRFRLSAMMMSFGHVRSKVSIFLRKTKKRHGAYPQRGQDGDFACVAVTGDGSDPGHV